jgi:hypothetical protein
MEASSWVVILKHTTGQKNTSFRPSFDQWLENRSRAFKAPMENDQKLAFYTFSWCNNTLTRNSRNFPNFSITSIHPQSFNWVTWVRSRIPLSLPAAPTSPRRRQRPVAGRHDRRQRRRRAWICWVACSEVQKCFWVFSGFGRDVMASMIIYSQVMLMLPVGCCNMKVVNVQNQRHCKFSGIKRVVILNKGLDLGSLKIKALPFVNSLIW